MGTWRVTDLGRTWEETDNFFSGKSDKLAFKFSLQTVRNSQNWLNGSVRFTIADEARDVVDGHMTC